MYLSTSQYCTLLRGVNLSGHEFVELDLSANSRPVTASERASELVNTSLIFCARLGSLLCDDVGILLRSRARDHCTVLSVFSVACLV